MLPRHPKALLCIKKCAGAWLEAALLVVHHPLLGLEGAHRRCLAG
jgi:hypothetical protein